MKQYKKAFGIAGSAVALLAFYPSDSLAISHEACPKPEKINRVSNKCAKYLIDLLGKNGFIDSTEHLRVLTYQKLDTSSPLKNDGILGPLTARAILKNHSIRPSSPDKSSDGHLAYIDKHRQVMYLLGNGSIKGVVSVSTGREQYYSEVDRYGNPATGFAHTPTGTFSIDRVMGPGYVAPLGNMPDAHFFYKGYAIHGGYVDNDGHDSHGCIRVENTTMYTIVAPFLRLSDTVKIVE